MNDTLLIAIREIEEADLTTLVERVFRFFSAINALDKAGIIAAYETLKFLEEGSFSSGQSADDLTRKRRGMIKRTIVTRMENIVAQAPISQRIGLAVSFKLVVTECWRDEFDALLAKLKWEEDLAAMQ